MTDDPWINASGLPIAGNDSSHSTPGNLSLVTTFKDYVRDMFEDPANDDLTIGILFASKAIFQLLFCCVSGSVIDYLGYDIPLTFGILILLVATIIFAFGETYTVLFSARSLQGVASAFVDTAVFAMIADQFKDDEGRNKAQGIALACVFVGIVSAPPLGGVLYQFAGKEAPFILLACIGLVALVLVRIIPEIRRCNPEVSTELNSGKEKEKKVFISCSLFVDPYISICAGAVLIANLPLAFIEPTIALWMTETLDASKWQVGVIWLPSIIPHIFGVWLTIKLSLYSISHQWLAIPIGVLFEGFGCLIIPFCDTFWELIFPLMIICFGIGLLDTAVLPILAHLVDVCHGSQYGSVYSIVNISYATAYALGPIFAGWILETLGFLWMNCVICAICVAYAPVTVILRGIRSSPDVGYAGFPDEASLCDQEEEKEITLFQQDLQITSSYKSCESNNEIYNPS